MTLMQIDARAGVLRHRVRLVLVALLAGLLLAGCGAPAPRPDRPEPMSDPQALFDAGRFAEAAEAWLAGDPIDATARLKAAEAWLAAGDTERARALLEALDPSALARPQRFRYDLVMAELALNRGDFSAAERVVALAPDQVPADLRSRLDRLRQRLNAVDPDAPEARLDALRDALDQPDFAPTLALALLIDVPLGGLDALREDPSIEPDLVPWLDLARTVRAAVLNPPALMDAAAAWAAAYPTLGLDGEAIVEWASAWRDQQPMPRRVAVLLPGQGPLLTAGEVLRDGIVAAWLDLPEARRPVLDFIALGEGPNAAVGAWFEARERGADFVLGPLDRSQIPALLALPDSTLPTLLLNRPPDDVEGPTPARPLAILALPPEEEAELAAIRALVEGHRRALVIAQDTDFGSRLAGRFIETFELGGGRVVERVDYPARESDVTDRLEQSLRINASAGRIDRVSALLGEAVSAEPQRRTDIDLVFLAARDEASQVQPQLRFLDLTELPTLATSHVLTPVRDRDLDGLAVPLSPWLLSGGERAEERRTAERIFDRTARSVTLSQLHALGRDAVALLPWLDAMKRDPRLVLSARVGRLRLADGVSLERDLPWAIIRDGQPVRP
jgi:outer membrane PBP1 activator LpoA protein